MCQGIQEFIHLEFQHCDATGTADWFDIHGKLFRNASGQPAYVLGTSEIITNRVKASQEMVKNNRLKALGEMAAGISHNLNNILMGILGPAQILQSNLTDPDLLEDVDTIYKSGLRARDLVKRLYRGVGNLQEILTPVEVNQTISEALKTTRSRWKDDAEARGITIAVTTQLANNLPSVKGTPSGLHEILLNLIFNAVDAMPQGGSITIATINEANHVTVSITDTGVGMDEQTRSRIFEPFFTTKMNVGTGLGLATVYGILKRWENTITVDSTPGKGTTFTFFLQPWRSSENQSPDGAPVLSAPQSKSLIVEDDETVGRTLPRMLKNQHDITWVNTPSQALNLPNLNQYSAILIDLGLPGMRGDQLAEALKKQNVTAPFILITGWHLDETDPKRAPFDFYLQKPLVSLNEIQTTIAQAIQKKFTS